MSDTFQLLQAGISTERPQLLEIFKERLVSDVGAEPLGPAAAEILASTIQDLAREVFALRRALRATEVCGSHIEQALNGVLKHVSLQRQVCTRAANGTLPDASTAEELLDVLTSESDYSRLKAWLVPR